MRKETEYSRLMNDESTHEQGDHQYMIMPVVINCNRNNDEVLFKAKEVIGVVLHENMKEEYIQTVLRDKLPNWFVEKCAKELSDEEKRAYLERKRSLPLEEQIALANSRGWSVENWIHWFEPENRAWFWWSCKLEGDSKIVLSIAVDSWPTATGSLEWLFTACGCEGISINEN